MTTRRGGPLYLLISSIGAIGVVYGDIGTSPLYAFREVFVAAEGLEATTATVLGLLSLVFWALVIIVSIKYLGFVMRADNQGEGGILALVALVTPKGPFAALGARRTLILLGLFGTALLYGDGIITPAISVLAAVEGLEVAAPALDSFVVPMAVLILLGLFLIQRRGTATIGNVFGPVMVVWFVTIALLGVSQILGDPSVFAAVNPWHGLQFISAEPRLSFLALGAIFLVVTGSEALYADMGHFGKGPIRLTWYAVVFPALLLNYFGQGALILADPTAVENPFYRMAPGWAQLPLVFLATAATVIASQALITGAFSLTLQAVRLGYLPRVHIAHTSPHEMGQVYIPVVNWGLMLSCIGLVVTFRSSSNLAAAYGVAVTTTMLITSVLLFVLMREVWGWSLPVAAGISGVFLVVDGVFFAANIIKVPAGGWFPLVVGAAVFIVMTTWKRGRALMTAHLRRGELPIERLIASLASHPPHRVPGTAVYLFPDQGSTPPALLANLRHNEVLHETVAVVAVDTSTAPRVPPAARTTAHHLGDGFHQLLLRYGFTETPDVPAALGAIAMPHFGFDLSDVVYVIGRETIVPSDKPGMALWREHLFDFLHRNAASAAEYFRLPTDQVIEVGNVIEI